MTLKQLEANFSNYAASSGRDYAGAFSEWLDFIITLFTPFANLSAFGDHAETLHSLTRGYFQLMDETLKSELWFDAWGDLFQSLMGKFAGYRGQFFTPAPLVDISTKLIVGQGGFEEGRCGAFGNRIKVADQACGSARYLLAANQHIQSETQKQPYLIGEDLDHLCVKMAAINLCVHGCYGEIICHDSLTQGQTPLYGYVVNEGLYPFPGLPTIRRFDSPSAFILFQ